MAARSKGFIMIFVFIALALACNKYPQKKPDTLLARADSLMDSGQYEEAIAAFHAILDSLENLQDKPFANDSVAERIGICYYKLNKYTEAIDWFQKALDVQREEKKLQSISTTLNNIGLNYKMRGNYDKAIEYYEQTIRIDEELGKGDEIAITLNNIGMVYRAWGKYDKAIEYLERSLRIKNSLNEQAGVSKSLNNMGLVYSDWKKYDQAILNFRESLKIEQFLENQGEIAKRLNNLGRVFFYQGQYDTARVYFENALEINRKINDQDQIAIAYNNIGKLYLEQEKYKEAADYLQSALKIYDDLEKTGDKATVLANLSVIQNKMGQNDQALQLLDSSSVIASSLNLRTQLQQNYLYYSEIYCDQGNYQQALESLKRHTALKDTIFSNENLKLLSDYQIKYETAKKEAEIQILRQNDVIQDLALKKQTIFRNSMMAVSVLLLALAGMIFYSLQLKKRDNRIIASAMKKSDQLLLNILPAGVANDLKEKGKTEPQLFNNVTVCFIDIVDFTQKSAILDPAVLIRELNEIFTAFDNIIENHSCERIKTIGDSYLAVAGLPHPDPDHAIQIVSSCIEMIRFIRNRNNGSPHPWEIRVGVHTGEVVAGVVGVKKYIYDVFGDTINVASRMESNSEPMKINISETTYHLVKGRFDTEAREESEVKGKGKLRMFFVKA